MTYTYKETKYLPLFRYHLIQFFLIDFIWWANGNSWKLYLPYRIVCRIQCSQSWLNMETWRLKKLFEIKNFKQFITLLFHFDQMGTMK